MDNMPIVRIEIEGIRRFTTATLLERNKELDGYIQQQIDMICTPEYLANHINEEVRRGVNDAIRESVNSYYKYYGGKDQIKELVDSYLKKVEPIVKKEENGSN